MQSFGILDGVKNNFSTPMNKNKKLIFGAVAVLLLLIPVVVFAVTRQKPAEQPEETTKKKKITKPVNVIPYEERPYVVMSPTGGREVDVTIYSLPKPAESVEYLAEYQFGTSLGGNEQFIDLGKGLPATKQFALYSRSAGGKTSYEEDVKGGTLRLDFEGADGYSLEQDWKYYDRVNPKSTTLESELVSSDGNFAVEDELTGSRYVIIYNSPGAPDELPGQRASEVYTFQTAGALPSSFDISITMSAAGEGTIYGYDGQSWEEFETTVSGTTATATVTPMDAYVVISQ